MATFEPQFRILEHFIKPQEVEAQPTDEPEIESFHKLFYELATESLALGGLWATTKDYDYEPPCNDSSSE